MTKDSLVQRVKESLRLVPDFPKKGIQFQDIMPLFQDTDLLGELIDQLGELVNRVGVDYLVGIESRGFLLASPLAFHLKVPLVPARKPGKLPPPVRGVDYQLEYGTDRVEVGVGVFSPEARVLIVDDVLATGGTASAVAQLIADCGALPVGALFLLEIQDLAGFKRLANQVPLIESFLKV